MALVNRKTRTLLLPLAGSPWCSRYSCYSNMCRENGRVSEIIRLEQIQAQEPHVRSRYKKRKLPETKSALKNCPRWRGTSMTICTPQEKHARPDLESLTSEERVISAKDMAAAPAATWGGGR